MALAALASTSSSTNFLPFQEPVTVSLATGPASLEGAGPDEATTHTYPEWDERRGVYRPDWCHVLEDVADADGVASVVLPDGATLRRALARLSTELVPCRRQRQGGDLDIDAVVDDVDAAGRNAILDKNVLDRPRRRDETIDLPVLPLRERVRLQVKIDTARGDDLRPRLRRAKRQSQRRHRHRVRIVRVDDLGPPPPHDLRQLPCRGEIDLIHRREREQVGTLGGAAEQLALGVRHQHGTMAAGPQAQHGQEDLLLSAAPGARGVDVEDEHSSQSVANFSPT